MDNRGTFRECSNDTGRRRRPTIADATQRHRDAEKSENPMELAPLPAFSGSPPEIVPVSSQPGPIIRSVWQGSAKPFTAVRLSLYRLPAAGTICRPVWGIGQRRRATRAPDRWLYGSGAWPLGWAPAFWPAAGSLNAINASFSPRWTCCSRIAPATPGFLPVQLREKSPFSSLFLCVSVSQECPSGPVKPCSFAALSTIRSPLPAPPRRSGGAA